MNNPKFQIFRSSANAQFYFRLKSANGETILSSEGYATNQSCRTGIASAKANAPFDSRYERKNAINKYSFNLRATNGEIIGRSESYTSSSARDNGIAAVKRDAPVAAIEDLS